MPRKTKTPKSRKLVVKDLDKKTTDNRYTVTQEQVGSVAKVLKTPHFFIAAFDPDRETHNQGKYRFITVGELISVEMMEEVVRELYKTILEL